MSTYALAVGDRVGTYPTVEGFPEALLEAYHLATDGESVTVLRVAHGVIGISDTRLVPLCTITPPVTPTTSTSPEVSA